MNIRTTILAAVTVAALTSTLFAAKAPKEDEPKNEKGKPDTPVLMIGDSMMRILGATMEKEFKKADIQPAVAFSSLGSGLVRPAVFNWTDKINELITNNNPKTVFIALGTNDRQALEAENGVINYGHPDWRPAYTKRIDSVMDQFINAGATRIVWFLLPPMKEAANQEHASLVNEIVTAEAATEERKDYVETFDMGRVLCRRPGIYSQNLMSPTGQALTVRDPDGVHLTREGAKVIAREVLKYYWNKK